MARKKLNLNYIAKDSIRRMTFKKRKRGLLKNAYELSTLCDVTMCVIVYGQNKNKPKIWPQKRSQVLQIIDKFKELPETEKIKNMLNQESFLRQRVSKSAKELAELSKENKEVDLRHTLLDGMAKRSILIGAGIEEVRALASMVEAKYSMVKARYELLKPQPLERPPPSTVLAPLSMPTNAMAEWDQSRLTFTIPMQGEQSVEDLLNSIDCYPMEWLYADPNQLNNPHDSLG
ncbi:agamous-like MADS-box protein AGL80 [Nymphaea colorata]|uniref:MADS-box domain-containing protein n=1 Tax=Nymphaea colorata TaxID=210225 RepID=A0A5K0X4W5_9MAGN|nr:agamous-like MADS-box protein AGL80 [Nymphaea colorata]